MTDLQATLSFLNDLSQTNSRPWFDTNRARYQQAAGAFEALVADVIAELGKLEDLGGVTPKDCIFRINRDVRFSRDKSPYKTQMGAVVGPNGRRSLVRSVYVHIEPHDASFIAGGLYEPNSEQLSHVRQHLAQDAQPFREIISAPEFVHWFGDMEGDRLKTAPQGYDRQHPDIDLLRYKQLLAFHRLKDADVVDDALVQRVVGARNAMQPFLAYLEEAAGTPS